MSACGRSTSCSTPKAANPSTSMRNCKSRPRLRPPRGRASSPPRPGAARWGDELRNQTGPVRCWPRLPASADSGLWPSMASCLRNASLAARQFAPGPNCGRSALQIDVRFLGSARAVYPAGGSSVSPTRADRRLQTRPKEVAEGAIIFRSGNKLYFVYGKEVPTSNASRTGSPRRIGAVSGSTDQCLADGAAAAHAAGITSEVRITFRGTGIMAYLENGGRLEKARQLAHASTHTTQLYDRREDRVTLDEVVKMNIRG